MDTHEKVARVRQIEQEIESSNKVEDDGRLKRLDLLKEQSGVLRDLGWDMVLSQEAISGR